MQTYAVALEKGGAGKTAVAVNLAAALHQAGLTVLLIDLDAQTSATHWLGIDAAAVSLERSVFGTFNEAISGRATAHSITDRARQSKDGVYVLPAHGQMAGLAAQLSGAPVSGLFLLAELLADLEQSSAPYDVVVIDLPPARGPLLGMALAAATRCIAPVQSEDLVIRALVALQNSIQQVRTRQVNQGLQFSILRNKYAPRSNADKVYDELLQTEYADQLLKTTIPIRAALRDSSALQQSIFRYSGPDVGEVRSLFLQLVEELIALDGHRDA